MKYNKLVSDMLNRFPELSSDYERLLREDCLDENSGGHTVFSYLFTTRLIKEITNKSVLSFRMMDFVAEMDRSNDKLVGEVAQFTVLEELCDIFEDDEIDEYFKNSNFNESRKQIRGYIV